ncbi:MAG: tRNA dihydrouridine(20/20a) synthase DusA [Gammaproteobacteria bacterium]|nr:tRNA dihydrouridine(20/20a) synthase DusA [Gammaproteobacteria bacterium]MBU6509175.1 tRNA dihydrouridine(20/20a) synthase DusA [Gammaproteobacteria bacterium]MDE1984174.1 tRNA dihydrouridine(20/20a) synthase DusA [Gammaproteobacteria bacterium]MDE2108784.1 tRNA dihydrouridine(20/20a) synthase DusA [Gammaproteobacteria bacterium]MDE2460238.1 tRNA dihydrouridine(20/20a) synthase DusA [Gammaproteobacteria bacterium]
MATHADLSVKPAGQGGAYRVCVAPMMDYTDRHFRYFIRLMSRHTRLYTEMLTTGALLRGAARRFLEFDAREHPLALQLGGSEPRELAACAWLAGDYGYDEVNLNVGCPSDRVQAARFGACLMKEPRLVGDCVAAMRAAAAIPVTVKTRLGVDELDSYEHLAGFVQTVAAAGCGVFIIHARKAWLKGLSPKENREIPPLCYTLAERLKRDFPLLTIVVNGGIQTLTAMQEHLTAFDGVMIGREAVANPYMFAAVDRQFFDSCAPVMTREQVLEAWLPKVRSELACGVPLARMTRHALGLFQGRAGARRWRRHLSEASTRPGAGIEVLRAALDLQQAA